MKNEIKVLFTGLSYLNHNYGAQGIAFPLMEKISSKFNAEYTFVLSRNQQKEYSFSREFALNSITTPSFFAFLRKRSFPIYLLYRLIKRKTLTKVEKRNYSALVNILKESDVVIDLSGIEFIGNVPLKTRYLKYLNETSVQLIAEKYDKLYIKYTKSYGPFPDNDRIYPILVKKQLNKLPFLFVRGKTNLNRMKKLGLDIPLYSFPDISLSLEAESRIWASDYISKLGIDTSKKLAGLSPSTVIAGLETEKRASCGDEHIKLCKEIIKFYQLNKNQVLLIPHSITDGEDLRSCDLALAKKIIDETKNKKNVFLVEDMDLNYTQVRAIIGLLDFYVTGRYHSLSSSLSMGIPTVSLSWHMKYGDIISLFLEDMPIIDCRVHFIEKATELVQEYYHNRQWFDREKVLERRKELVAEIDKSVNILTSVIESRLDEGKTGY